MNTAILINTRDRPTELSLLLESLRVQTNQEFDIFILDDMGGTALNTYHFFNCLVSRLKLESHKVFLKRTEFPHGVSRARQNIVDWALEYDYDYFLRVDDDVILEPNFIEKLLNVINQGYDISSGVTPPLVAPMIKRDSKFITGGVVNCVVLDKEGNFIHNGDDCGMLYLTDDILPAHHFRSSALMTRKVMENVKYYPTKLTKHGYREEEIFSFKAIMKGFKIGVDMGAIAWHLLTPSGGERFADSNNLIVENSKVLAEFVKDNKDELRKHFPEIKLGKELLKESNLI